jgi:hypothetical protein
MRLKYCYSKIRTELIKFDRTHRVLWIRLHYLSPNLFYGSIYPCNMCTRVIFTGLSPIWTQTLPVLGCKATNRKNNVWPVLSLRVYFTPGFTFISCSNNILNVFHNCSINVRKLNRLLWLLKWTWLNTFPEDDTGVLKHVRVTSL